MERIPFRRVSAALLAAGLLVAACGDDDTETAAGDTTTTTAPDREGEREPAQESTTTSAVEDDEEPVDTGQLIEVTVTDGSVEGGGRTSVSLGDTVTIRVTSDANDHIHLHGYDVLVDIVAGEPAELTFEATIPGVFEVELEDSRIPLVDLEIS